MQGVTIIETITEMARPMWFTIGMCTFLGVCAIIITGMYLWSVKTDDTFLLTDSPILKFFAWLVTLICCASVFFSCWNHRADTFTQYIVEVDETASVVEFTEKYDIISQDGNRYTVQEKEAHNHDSRKD